MKIHSIKTKLVALVLVIATSLMAFSVVSLAAGNEADAFNAAVTALEAKITNSAELSERQTALEAADEKLAAYLALEGAKTTDSAITTKYKKLISIKTSMFIEYVELADAANDDNDYPTTRLNLDYAEALVEDIDTTNKTASSYKVTYSELLEELREPELTCENFIARVKAAKEATAYKEVKKNYDSALVLENSITLVGYEGVEEAKADLKTIKAYINTSILSASFFINAVDEIYSADNLMTAVEEAYGMYEDLDPTIDGVPAAKSKLDKLVRDYDKSVKAANDFADEANTLVFALAFSTGGGSANPLDSVIDWFGDLIGSITGG